MTEGWNRDDYVVLFSGRESHSATERYGIAALLPGYRIVGLRGWDDFIVQDEMGDTFKLPTVPYDHKELVPFQVPASDELVRDNRFAGKVKGYVTLYRLRPREKILLRWSRGSARICSGDM